MALALLAFCVGGATAVDSADQTAPAPQRMVGTVRTVDASARVIELTTGVGYAVRIIRFRVADDCRIMVPRGASALSSLTRGAYARVAFVAGPARARAPDHLVAVSIEAFSAQEEGDAP
jgi:hypothetical protein